MSKRFSWLVVLAVTAILACASTVSAATSKPPAPSNMPYCDPSECGGGGTSGFYDADTSTHQSGLSGEWQEYDPGAQAISTCRSNWAEVLTQDPTGWVTSTRSKLVWSWCYNGARITKIGGMYAFSQSSVWPWNYRGVVSGPTKGLVGQWSSYILVQFRYEACIVWKGCFFNIYPWLWVELQADGHWQVSEGGSVNG